jgi:hypothetical protein
MDIGFFSAALDLTVAASLGFDGNDTSDSPLSVNDAFKIDISGYGTSKAAKVIEQVIEDTKLREWIYPIARDVLRDGDTYVEPLCQGMDLLGIWYHDARQIVVRRDTKGRLEQGTTDVGGQQLPLAYRQVDAAGKILGAWFPSELCHVRHWPTLKSPYSEKSFISPYRDVWKKYQWVQESQVVARIVRSPTRLLHRVDLSGKSPKEAEETFKKYVRAYSMKTGGGASAHQLMEPDSDIFIGTGYVPDGTGKAMPKLSDVEMLDPKGTGFAELGDIHMILDEMFAAIPSNALGVRDQNSNELTSQELAWQGSIRRFQRAVLERQLIRPLIDLGLSLRGFKNVSYNVIFPSPLANASWKNADAIFRASLAMVSHLDQGTTTREFWLKRLFGLSEEQAVAEVQKGLEQRTQYPVDKGSSSAQRTAGNQSAGLDPAGDLINELVRLPQ